MIASTRGIGMTSQRTRDRLVSRLREEGIRNEAVLDVLRRLAGAVRLIVVAAPDAADYPDATRVVRLVEGRPA